MRCSALAEELGEPMIGSVDQRVRWLLVEDRSAWGSHAVREVLGAELEAAAKARGMRLLLVRRREGDPAADSVRRAFLVDTVARRMAVRTVDDPAELTAHAGRIRRRLRGPAHRPDPAGLHEREARRVLCAARSRARHRPGR